MCPSCGAAQYEPRLVVYTFCKKCGVHLTVHKRRVTASSVTRSGAGMADAWTTVDAWTGAEAAKPEALKTAPPVSKPEEKPAPAETLSPADGFGAFLQSQGQSPESPPPSTAPAEINASGEPMTASMRRPQSNSPPPTPAPAPHTASSLQKMKEQGMYRNQYFKDAECFDCGHKFKTGRSAKSANCPACGAYFSLEDVEINMTSTQVVKTRGDVLIRKRGRLSTSSVHCRDLECHGIIEANVTCSGDATFRTTGSIIGEIRCNRFVVEKGADVAFLNAVHATDVEIQARVTGTIYSTGLVLINSNGSVNGDVTARSVSIEPGGELNGAMNIVRGKSTTPAPAPGA
ncbi:polymer-forming cytoskeletal protein [Prosthecobacter sp.]|uniref:bactofilin family protein n=1 Tax=Prosthecobacter sp. TaxID=1965333 RepID=UPI002AB9D48E|nr:polymer-forming cytoskeletal protein [Prosthecobacter sp.]MDZ4404808.1 polymer-forming cytoskeletal protein [Prosthecobacter sp.]